MRKILLLTIAISSCVISLLAQKQDTIYYNRNWDVTTKDLAGYYRVETEINTEDTIYWSFEDRYIENDQVQNEGFILKERYEVRQGKWTWYYENGKMEMTGDYVRNNRVGEWIFNHNNGALKKKGVFTDEGRLDGEWVWYHADSSFMSKAIYKEDTLVGNRDWFYPNGTKRISEYFIEGRLDSVRTEWHSTGVMKSQTHYKGGFKQGNEKIWYLNGELKSDINYSFGIAIEEVWFNMDGDTVAKDDVVDEKEFHNLLWKITGNGIKKPSYLFGTMHVKDKSAFEFSDSMLLAFNSAEGYSMEIHPDSLYAYSFKQFDKYKSWNHFGTEVIGESDPTEYYQNWGTNGYGSYGKWVMNLNQIFHRDVYNPEGMPYFVDCYLHYLATKNGKYTDGIERVIDHVNAGKNLPSNTRQYDILTKFNPAEEMLTTYQEGNLDKINALMEFLQNEEFRYRLLTVRNIKMAEAIDSLAQLRSTFNTAGTAHLPGEDGVIKLLEDKGYTLTPVTAVFSGDSLDPNVTNFNTKWREVKPYKTDFTVNSPGPLTAFGDGLTRNVFLDPIREIGVDAFQLDEKWYATGSKSTKVEGDDINYLFSNPYVISNEKIVHNGTKGVEVYWSDTDLLSTRIKGSEDIVYNRSRIFKKDFQIYVLTVAALNKDSLKGDFANKYIKSIKWLAVESKPKKWVTYEDDLGAFKINAPENADYRFIHYQKTEQDYEDDKYEHKVHYWVSEDQGNKYIFRYSNSPNRSFFYNDSSILASQIDYYRDLSSKDIDTSFFEYKGVPGLEATIKTNKEYLLKIKSFNRGYRHYQLIAQVDKEDGAVAADKFFDSFEFKELESLELKEYTTKDDSVRVMFPELIDEDELTSYRWFVPSRELRAYSGNHYSYDWGYDKKSISSYYNRYTYNADDYVEAYKNRNKFFGIDTAQGVTYELFVETFSVGFALPNRDSLFNYYRGIFFNKKDTVITEVRDSVKNIHTLDLIYEAPYQNGQGHLRFTQKGQIVVTQRMFYPEELIGNENVELFYSSLDLSLVADTVDLFEDKSMAVLDSLMSKDTLTQRRARKTLSFYPFDSTHVASIQSHVLQELALDTNDIENNTMDLLNLLTYVNDSTTAPFIYNVFSTKHTDSLAFRYKVLKVLKEIDDSLSYKADLVFLNDSIQDFDNNSEVYKNVLSHLKDSLQLFADNFDKTENWTQDTIWRLETRILELANTAFLDDSINTEGIEKNKERLLEKYYWTAAVYDSLDKDTSIYFSVVRNMVQYTELMGHLAVSEDSSKQIFLRLLEDKNKVIRLAATKTLFRGGGSLSDKKKEKLFSELKNRYKFMLILDEINNLEEIPEQYKSKKEIAKAQFYYSLTTDSDAWGNYHNNRPVKIKLLKEVKDKRDGKDVMFYVFSYYEDGRDREKRIGVSNPLPIKEDHVFHVNPSYKTVSYYGSEKKMIQQVIEEWEEEFDQNSEIDYSQWGEVLEGVEEPKNILK